MQGEKDPVGKERCGEAYWVSNKQGVIFLRSKITLLY